MKLLSTFILSILSTTILANDYIVEFKNIPSTEKIKNLSKKIKIERFDSFKNYYFNRAYFVQSSLPKADLVNLINSSLKVNSIEPVSQIAAMSVSPAQTLSRFNIDDQLLAYQWGLVSQGQKVRKDKDDINYVLVQDQASQNNTPAWLTLLGDQAQNLPPEVLASLLNQTTNHVDHSDINFIGFQSILRNELPEVKVAVIDSGIDFGHQDLKNAVAKNLAECNDDGGTNYDSREDLDDNGVPGDCLGWNFTVHKNDPRAKLPMDDAGHGTHVAGIIAAQSKNNFGVSGMGNNIKIVPIKVLHQDESSDEAKQISFTDRVARGILYAIKRDVDVINLSLGWLRQSDTKYLREAVNAALARGIPVIAAAGNNGSNARLFPCSYPGVICVGASTIEGKSADFSNHGGNVDIYAPGESILSTWPVTRVPLEFSVHGYEIQSGTSQATPFVSGAVAQLKAMNQGIRLPEIQARLLLSSNSDILKQNPKIGLSGRLDMAKLISITEQPAIIPVFKNLDEISYTLSDRKFRFPLPIVNYWKAASDIKVRVSTNSHGIELVRHDFLLEELANAKSKTLPIEGKIVNTQSDRSVELKIEITENDTTKTYYHNINFVRLLINDPEVEEKTISFLGQSKPLALVQEGELVPLITTLESFYGTAAPEWFLRRNVDNNVEFSFFKVTDQAIEETQGFSLKNSKRILSIISMDFNSDEKDDRLVRSTKVNDAGEETAIVYSFRSKSGDLLFGDKSDWSLSPDVAVANESLAFIKAELTENLHVPAPIFVAEGKLPESQQPTGFFDRRDEMTRKRIYTLNPIVNENGEVVLETLSIDTPKNIEKWKEELGLRWSDKLEIVSLIAPTFTENSERKVRILAVGGHAFRRVEAIIHVQAKDEFTIEKISTKGIRLENQESVRISSINNNLFSRHEHSGFIGFYDGKRARTSVIGDELKNQTFKISNEFDNFTGHIGSFLTEDQLTSIYSTSNKLVLVQQLSNEQRVLERPLERFDFLPGQVFNELFWPIARENSKGILIPSLYVDTSSIHTNSIHVIEIDNDKIIAPMHQSVLLPPNCKSLNPVVLPHEISHRTTMLCLEKERGFVFKFVK